MADVEQQYLKGIKPNDITLLACLDSWHDFGGFKGLIKDRLFKNWKSILGTEATNPTTLISSISENSITLSNVEDDTITYLQSTYPDLLSTPIVINNSEFTTDAVYNSVRNYNAIRINIDAEKRLKENADFILRFLFNLAPEDSLADEHYITFDAGMGIVAKIFEGTKKVRRLITPQNITDSAVTNLDNINQHHTATFLPIGAGDILTSNSNTYSQGRGVSLVYTNNSQFLDKTSFDITQRYINTTSNTIEAEIHYDIKHTSGPPISMLKDYLNRPIGVRGAEYVPATQPFTQLEIAEILKGYNGDVMFDIKRGGDYDQANMAALLNKTSSEVAGRVIFSSIDKLSAYYSRILDVCPTILHHSGKKNSYITLYRPLRVIDERTTLFNFLSSVNKEGQQLLLDPVAEKISNKIRFYEETVANATAIKINHNNSLFPTLISYLKLKFDILSYRKQIHTLTLFKDNYTALYSFINTESYDKIIEYIQKNIPTLVNALAITPPLENIPGEDVIKYYILNKYVRDKLSFNINELDIPQPPNFTAPTLDLLISIQEKIKMLLETYRASINSPASSTRRAKGNSDFQNYGGFAALTTYINQMIGSDSDINLIPGLAGENLEDTMDLTEKKASITLIVDRLLYGNNVVDYARDAGIDIGPVEGSSGEDDMMLSKETLVRKYILEYQRDPLEMYMPPPPVPQQGGALSYNYEMDETIMDVARNAYNTLLYTLLAQDSIRERISLIERIIHFNDAPDSIKSAYSIGELNGNSLLKNAESELSGSYSIDAILSLIDDMSGILEENKFSVLTTAIISVNGLNMGDINIISRFFDETPEEAFKALAYYYYFKNRTIIGEQYMDCLKWLLDDVGQHPVVIQKINTLNIITGETVANSAAKDENITDERMGVRMSPIMKTQSGVGVGAAGAGSNDKNITDERMGVRTPPPIIKTSNRVSQRRANINRTLKSKYGLSRDKVYLVNKTLKKKYGKDVLWYIDNMGRIDTIKFPYMSEVGKYNIYHVGPENITSINRFSLTDEKGKMFGLPMTTNIRTSGKYKSIKPSKNLINRILTRKINKQISRNIKRKTIRKSLGSTSTAQRRISVA